MESKKKDKFKLNIKYFNQFLPKLDVVIQGCDSDKTVNCSIIFFPFLSQI